jgi:hypothetical protein
MDFVWTNFLSKNEPLISAYAPSTIHLKNTPNNLQAKWYIPSQYF